MIVPIRTLTNKAFFARPKVPENKDSSRAAILAAAHRKLPERPLAASAKAPNPDEGAELIRAFLRVERPEVRAAIIELAVRLAESTRPSERE